MGSSIAVNQANFAAEVLEKSYQMPVLVDFFAQWCGPCQMLKPMLETLAQEYDFVLAKVDIDQNPELAQTYGVQGVPDVRIVIDGDVSDGFVGVLPEPQLRDLMAQLNLKSTIATGLEQLYRQAAMGHVDTAIAALQAWLQRSPNHAQLQLEAARFYLETNHPDEAAAVLANWSTPEKRYETTVNELKARLFFHQMAQAPIGEHPLDTPFQQAAQAVLQHDYSQALEQWLAIVERDRAYRQDGARKAMLAVFDLLGSDHPITKNYRKRLMLALY